MEHPPKQGLKPEWFPIFWNGKHKVLMEHPPKQGLKQNPSWLHKKKGLGF